MSSHAIFTYQVRTWRCVGSLCHNFRISRSKQLGPSPEGLLLPRAFSSRFSGFSICHPIYHENTMLLATRHAIYSAAVSTEETTTFMLLPSWNKNMTTNSYASLCRKYPRICNFLGTIPSNHLHYAKVFFWDNIQIPLSKHS